MWLEHPYSCHRRVHVSQLRSSRAGILKIGGIKSLMDWKAPSEPEPITFRRLAVDFRLGLGLMSLGIRVSTVLAIDLTTDAVLRGLCLDMLKDGGMAKDAKDFVMGNAELPLPITLACGFLIEIRGNLRYSQLS